MDSAFPVKPCLKNRCVVLESKQIRNVTEEHLRNLSLEGTVPHFTRSLSWLTCSKVLFSSYKEKGQQERAEGINIMKIWCRTNQLVLQGFTLRVVLNTGARVKCLNGNEGMKVEVNMQHMGKKKWREQGLETSFYQEREDQRKKIILLKVYNYNNILSILIVNKFWLSAKWFVAEKDYCH